MISQQTNICSKINILKKTPEPLQRFYFNSLQYSATITASGYCPCRNVLALFWTASTLYFISGFLHCATCLEESPSQKYTFTYFSFFVNIKIFVPAHQAKISYLHSSQTQTILIVDSFADFAVTEAVARRYSLKKFLVEMQTFCSSLLRNTVLCQTENRYFEVFSKMKEK